ncbi:MAG: hypothetical protein WBC70_08975 [Candidatus Aminicenantales bacterium]
MIRLRAKKESLPLLKTEPRFLESIQLCRILSAIQYNKVIYALLSERGDFDTNLQLNLVINHAAVLYEGIKKFNTLGESLKYLESYKKNIEKIEKLADRDNSFINEILHNIRRKVAFHFDKQVITHELAEFIDDCIRENEDMIFLAGNTEQVKDMRFLLADSLNLRFIVGLVKGEDLSYVDKFKILAKKLTELSGLFCDILEEIIPEMAADYCELVEQE